ncbi:alkaline phosphatase [Marinimicrobium sp. ABcell2]|uniref:alkaline phosphatase n=1 Tax=Marinimicrobium sp. ABcell2 TaxID=3069751 RepID=UPI0027B51567|nr:alkaline phosphatase [Marinimicrobium sp. ABcell2]MDQ2075978.1 alkaline phosphatase [Marinimicrobium sp. ABcell2]
MRNISPIALSLLLLTFAASSVAAPKNIIVMVGDGMGPSHVTGYRHMQHTSGEVKPTILDELLVGWSSTHPDDDTIVTDSASSATALATGHKTCNLSIAMDCNDRPLKTLFQKAKQHGKWTGIAVTSQVNHATPAPFYAHSPTRHQLNEIADQLVDNRVNEQLPVDVILGGGVQFFVREDRNLVEELKAEGYQYADSWKSLNKLDRAPALGLLAKVALPSALESPVPDPLATLTDRALQLLSKNEKGFVLVVEGSQIDWCSHANDIACAMAEMDDFAAAVTVARDFVDAHPDTLLVITGDHETGGLSLGANNQYHWHPHVIRGVKLTANTLSDRLLKTKRWQRAWQKHTGIELDEEEQSALSQARSAGKEELATAIKDIINRRSHTGWTSHGHTAVDVPIMAYGAGSERFHGFVDNADIGARLMEAIGD